MDNESGQRHEDEPQCGPGPGDGPDARDAPDGEAARDEVAAGAEGDPSAPGGHTALPPKLEAWRRRSAAGAILTGFALGLQEALEKRKEDPSIMMETSGDPPKDLPVEAEFEYGRPRQSTVQIRPWLLPSSERAGASGAEAAPKSDDGDGTGSADEQPTGEVAGEGTDQ